MSTSWRIQVINQDRSSTVIPTVGNIGASVIRSYKGPLQPLYIGKGQEKTILNIFGTPSSTYPDIWDAIEFNKKSGIWLSAPSVDGLYGGVLVTKTGTKPLVSGFSAKTGIDFTQIPYTEQIGIGDDSTLIFTYTISDKTDYIYQSIDITVNGVSINVDATDAEPEVLTTTPNVGSGTYTRATGLLSFTFATAPAEGDIINVTYKVDKSANTYFILFNKDPQADDKGIKTTFDSTNKIFTVQHYNKNSDSTYTEMPGSPYQVSLTPNTKNGFGQNIYIEETFRDNVYLDYFVNTSLAVTTFTDDTTIVDMNGGDRGGAISLTELTLGWNYFQQVNSCPADIFMDFTADPGIATIFETLRTTYQKYSSYIIPLPASIPSTALTNRTSLGLNNRGICIYWNWAQVRNTYTNSVLTTALIGRVGGKFADMVDVYNGLAPSWIDENNHGGQLGSGIIKMLYDATEDELKQMDDHQINPIVFDPLYGVMIKSQKTSQITLSDFSYIGHSRTADYIINNVVVQALPPQLTKLNDAFHRKMVKSKADAIVNPLLAPNISLLREAINICDETNNTDDVLAKREFILETRLKFTPFSETIKFYFTNVDQQTSVTE